MQPTKPSDVDSPPTKEMLAAAQEIAARNNFPLPKEVTQRFEDCQKFLPEHHDLPVLKFVTGIVLGAYAGWLLSWIFLELLSAN